MFDVSVDQYIFPNKKAEKSTARKRLDAMLDGISDTRIHIITETAKAILDTEKQETEDA